MSNTDARIAALFRELAEAFEIRSRGDKPKTRRNRGQNVTSAERAAERVRDNLRKQGVR